MQRLLSDKIFIYDAAMLSGERTLLRDDLTSD